MNKSRKTYRQLLISILLLAFMVFFCCCGIDTSTVAGNASQVYQQDESQDEITDEESVEETADESEYDNELDESVEEWDTEDSQDEEGPVILYVLNTNTKKFHYPDCGSVKQMKDKNKLEEETTREDLIGRGYDPCGNCNP